MHEHTSRDDLSAAAVPRPPVAARPNPLDHLGSHALDATGVAVAQIDAHGIVRAGNEAFYLLTGACRRDVERGRLRWADLLPETAIPVEGAETPGEAHFHTTAPWEAELRRADATTVSVLVCGGPGATRSEESVAVLVELPSRMRAEQRFRAQLACARILAEGCEPVDAAGRLLRPLCWMLGFDGGLFWVGDEDGPLRLLACWFDTDALPVARLEASARDPAAAAIGGPAAQCRSERRIIWADRLQEYAGDSRSAAFRAAGLAVALAVPIVAGSRVLGVLEFVARHADLPDDQLLATLTAIAAQLAQFLERHRSEVERQALQQRLAQAHKLEAVGRLAGGIAHDFNNLLTVINGYAELLAAELPADACGQEYARQIVAATERATALIRQLLTFSRQVVLEPSVVDLNELVRESEAMIRRLIGADIRLSIDLRVDPALVKVDAGQMHQVVLNLVANARDAMPRGGRLTIETARVVIDAAAAAHPEIPPGRYVRLSVRDSGSGMDEATRARIFEPFFTTKKQGRGSGMGLAIVYGIVQASGGQIRVVSQPGQSTSFDLYLPQATMAPAGRATAARPGRGVPGQETILLVEDETEVRQLFGRVLAAAGYRVLPAANGQEALQLAATCAGPIDLLVTDVVMPGMSGRQVAEALQARLPGLLVLYLSGYTDDAILRHGVLSDAVAFLQKPVTPAALTTQVRFLLDTAARDVRRPGEWS